MDSSVKSIAKLLLTEDGRGATNWGPYKMQVENFLAGIEKEGIRLLHLLQNKRTGVRVSDPGDDADFWIAAAPAGEERTVEQFNAATAAFDSWDIANRVTHAMIQSTLPDSLHEDCFQRPLASELWIYLDKRFAGLSITSAALIQCQLFNMKLVDYANVNSFLTELNKRLGELKSAGGEVPDLMCAGLIMNAMGDMYPTTRELLNVLPSAEQTKTTFETRLLEAERNARLMSEVQLVSTKRLSKVDQAGAETAAAAGLKKPCGYRRKVQGRQPWQTPGSVCKGPHSRQNCYAQKDDVWLKQHKDKTAEDLPDWRSFSGHAKTATFSDASSFFTPPSDTYEDADASDVTADLAVDSGDFDMFSQYSGVQQTAPQTCTNTSSPTLTDTIAASATLPQTFHTIVNVLDSGATNHCLKEGINFKLLPKPIHVNGMSSHGLTITHTAELPCPVLPGGMLRGLYSPAFRHNLISVKPLQKQGIRVVFPEHANTAVCVDSVTNKDLWKFTATPTGLYTAHTTLPTATVCTTEHTTDLLHQRLGHISDGYLRTLIGKKAVTGLPPTWAAPSLPHHVTCRACIEAKAKKVSHPPSQHRAAAPLARVHADLVGPVTDISVQGHRYWLTLVDDYSRCGWSIPLKTKDLAKQAIITWVTHQELLTGHKLVTFHSDRGSEFLTSILKTYIRRKGAHLYLSNPATPQQNGVAEARNKTVGTIARALILHSHAPRTFWNFAVHHANLLANLYPHHLLAGQTPTQVWTGSRPDCTKLRVWGCLSHVLLTTSARRLAGGKFAPKTKSCAYLGPNPDGPGHYLWDPSTSKVVRSSDVTFQEHLSFWSALTDAPSPPHRVSWDPLLLHSPPSVLHHPPAAPASPPLPPPAAPASDPAPPALLPPLPTKPPRLTGMQLLQLPSSFPPQPAPQGVTGGASGGDGLSASVLHALMQVIAGGESGLKHFEIPTPQTYLDAVSGQHALEWQESMAREYNGLMGTGTFTEVARDEAPNVIKSKWVFKVKRLPTGGPFFKSRLVAKGFSQKHGVDYYETWAPTARQATTRTILHLAAHLDLEIHSMDVDQAFLQGDLEEQTYLEPPPGVPLTEQGRIWKLNKPLYGLKQAPRQWYAKLRTMLQNLGFKPSAYDPSLYIHTGPDGKWVLVYVDDLLLMATNLEKLSELKNRLKELLPLKDLGEVTDYLGMEITRDRETKLIYLSQKRYIQEVTRRFQDFNPKPFQTPLAVNHNLTLPSDDEDPVEGQERYPELVGCLMYLMVCTRPDIAHALSVLGRFVAPGRHGPEHWKAALRVLGYIQHTADYQLTLGGPDLTLEGYTDASWADDLLDRRSSQGHCLVLGSGAISWKATKSSSVALSSCEAELYGGTSAAQDMLWLKRLAEELGIYSKAPVLWCDNKSTIALTKDPIYSARSKHIEARYHFLRELNVQGELTTKHIGTEDNVADIFTKPLLRERHQRLTQLLGLTVRDPSGTN